MKKMEKTAGEKPGKEAAILKDNEAAAGAENGEASKLSHDSKKTDKQERKSDSDVQSESKKEASSPVANDSKNSSTPSQLTEAGKGLKSAVEGQNSNSPLPTDDDGAIVL